MNTTLKAKEIIASSLDIPIENIADDAKLSDIEQIDSLAFENIICGVEACLGHKVDSLKLLELRSIKDLANLLKEN